MEPGFRRPLDQCEHCHREMGRFETLFLIDNQTKSVCRDCRDELCPTCPYCGVHLNKRLRARGKCDACGRSIVVEGWQTLFPSSMITGAQREELHRLRAAGVGSLLGEPHRRYADRKEQLRAALAREPTIDEVLDSLREDITHDAEIQETLHHLKPLGVTQESWVARESDLQSSLGRGPTCAEIADSFWKDILRDPVEPDASNEYGRRFSVYFRMADWLRRSGRDHAPALQQAEVCRLRQSQCAGIRRVKVLAEAGTCKACRQKRSGVLGGKRSLGIEAAIEAVPQLIGCSHEGCIGLMFEAIFEGERP